MDTEDHAPTVLIVDGPHLSPTRRFFLRCKSALVNWLFEDVKVASLRFGHHSVSIGDRITFNDDQSPTAAGQLGMSASSGRPRAYIGGQARELPGMHEVMLADGSVASGADQDWGGFRLTNLGQATADADAPTWLQVQDHVTARIDALEWSDGVDAATTTAIAGSATLSGATLTAASNGAFPTVDGLAPALQQAYLLKDEGDEKDGVWTLTTLGDASAPWVLTRRSDFAVGDAVAGRILPVLRGSTHGGTDWRVSSAAGADVVGSDTISFSIRTITNDHGSLIGLADDDHSIYALLAGRSGGQVLVGGSGSGEHLSLSATAHATKGLVKVLDPMQLWGHVGLAGDLAIRPDTSGQGSLGTANRKLKEVNALVVNMGDAVMQSPEDPEARFIWVERGPEHLVVINPRTGRAWDVLSAANARPASEAELQRALAGPVSP
jgi:hypothetical protein